MLTGRRRYREQKIWFRPSLLVLQVEAKGRSGPFGDAYFYWRDATVSDLMIIPVAIKSDFPLKGVHE